jgi:hypothetical protein
MKLLLAALLASAATVAAQDRRAELKHQYITTADSLQPIALSALEIQRALPYDGVVHLKGSVEIKTPVCLATGPGTAHSCAGYVVLRAEQADFHEDSGQIEASGNVKVTRER